jgi:hypothetical protein
MLGVIGAGFGRTGTKTVKNALEIIGAGPCHHMHELVERPENLKLWSSVLDGTEINWNQIFQGYNSQIDWPGAVYWKELAVFYPEAKVIHTVRDPESWYESLTNTIIQTLTDAENAATSDLRNMRRFAREIICNRLFQGRFSERDWMIDRFCAHNDEVVSTISQERLLVFDVKEGWEPLCAFLNVATPATEFPHVNSSKKFWDFQKQN